MANYTRAIYVNKLRKPHTNYHLLQSQQEPYRNVRLVTKNVGESSGKKSQEKSR